MTANELIAEARRTGVSLALVEGKLKATPPGLLRDDLREALREHAREVKALLTPQSEVVELTMGRCRSRTPPFCTSPLRTWPSCSSRCARNAPRGGIGWVPTARLSARNVARLAS